jgi:ubiquinone biosynthesis protein Coq4
MRIAVTTAHVAFVNPRFMVTTMDAITLGWSTGQQWKNLHFTKWEEQLDRPLADIRAEYGGG